ncbi:MAG: xanthine dehydrogenase family protein molybdopterin-binding subunit [Proteobacteria bacterium]|nr:xanthine dehydrogenase family protein molybdopterin-binding subunit [Pseudomonadota bacterium]
MASFGSSVKRVEDPVLLRGEGRFTDDIHLPGALYAAMLRSPYGHARIKSIETSEALAMDGVHLVLTNADLESEYTDTQLPLMVPNPVITKPVTPYMLAKEFVRYVGEPVALVVADDRYIAEDALERIFVDFESLPVAGDFREAAKPGTPVAHVGLVDNICATFTQAFGDVDAVFANAPHVFKDTFFQHRGAAHPLETRAMMASYDKINDHMTFYAASQSPHRIREIYSKLRGIDDNQVRILVPDIGGGFGAKGQTYPEYFSVAAASRRLGRPVKYMEDRRENFTATHHERDQLWEAEIAFDDEGTILGFRGTLLHDSGAYVPWGIITPFIAASTVPGPYLLPAYELKVTCVLTNKVAVTPVRGAGRPQAAFTMERMMDLAARELGRDPAALRRQNYIPADQMPYPMGLIFRDGSPVIYDSGDYPGCHDKAIELSGYENFKARQAKALEEGRYIGIGIASYVEGTGLGPFEGANVRVAPSGKVTIHYGASAQGQGHQTVFAQVASDQLGVPLEDITVVGGDSQGCPYGVGTFASRAIVNAGNAVHVAAGNVRVKILKAASHMMEAAIEDMDLADGKVFVKGVPEMSKTLGEVAEFVNGKPGFTLPGDLEPGLQDLSYFTPKQAVYANGTHLAEVEVDIETGYVKVLKYWTGHDCGNLINPMTVEGQVLGGVAHGLGNALFEWMLYDENAQPLTVNYGEYLIPLATDMPRVEQVHQETPTPQNPLGVKGAGEGGTIPAIAVIIGAIDNALQPFGVRISEAPITPPRLLELIEEATHK